MSRHSPRPSHRSSDRKPRLIGPTSPPAPHRRLLVLWIGLIVMTIGVLAAAAVLVPSAQARPQDGHGPHGAVVEAVDGTAELGQFHLGETIVWCIDLNSWGPQKSSGWVTTRTDQIRKQTSFGDRGGHTDVAGALVTREEIAELAWALEWAQNHVRDDASAIAVDHFIRLRTVGDAAQQARMTNRWDAAIAAHPDAQQHLERLESLVDEQAGPYRMELALNAEDRTARAQVVGRAGVPIPDRKIEVTTNGSTSHHDTGPEGTVEFDLPRIESGEVTVAATATMPGSIPVLHTARHYEDENHTDYRIQRMLSAGTPAQVEARDTFRVGADTPTVVTVANTPEAEVGAELHDVVQISGANGYRGTGEATLWGPFDRPPGRNQCRDDDPVAGTVQFEVDGPGTHRTPAVTVTEPGHYTWVVSLPGVAGSEPVRTPCGIEAESTHITAAPQIATDIEVDPVTEGAVVRDQVHIKGLHGATAQVNATLWGPFADEAGKDDCRPGDPVAGEVSMTVTGDGSHRTPPVSISEPGHYVWTVALTAESVAGTVTTACGDPREMTQLTPKEESTPTAQPSTPDAQIPTPIRPGPETPTPPSPTPTVSSPTPPEPTAPASPSASPSTSAPPSPSMPPRPTTPPAPSSPPGPSIPPQPSGPPSASTPATLQPSPDVPPPSPIRPNPSRTAAPPSPSVPPPVGPSAPPVNPSTPPVSPSAPPVSPQPLPGTPSAEQPEPPPAELPPPPMAKESPSEPPISVTSPAPWPEPPAAPIRIRSGA